MRNISKPGFGKGVSAAAVWALALISVSYWGCRFRPVDAESADTEKTVQAALPEPGPAAATAPPAPPDLAALADPDDPEASEESENRDIAAAGARLAGAEPVRVVYPAQSIEHLVVELNASVVNIRTTVKVKGGPSSMYPGAPPNEEDAVSLGSGVIIDGNGHVLTNDHILAQARDLRVLLPDDVEVPAQVIGRAPGLDVALLKVDVDIPLRPAQLGDSSGLRVGEWVVALGDPFGRETTASAGIISSLDGINRLPNLGTPPESYRSFLVTDAAIHPGNSGGPLVDITGKVVGISTATHPQGARLGFAVPINRVRDVLPMLTRDGRVRRTWLGVFIHPVSAAEASRRGLDSARGALVSDVVPGSPAAKAGIQAQDIVLKFDERAVDHHNLPWISATTGPDRRIPVVVWRDSNEIILEFISELMPE